MSDPVMPEDGPRLVAGFEASDIVLYAIGAAPEALAAAIEARIAHDEELVASIAMLRHIVDMTTAPPVAGPVPPRPGHPPAAPMSTLHALRKTLRFWRSHIPRYLRGEISKIVAELAEKYRAGRSWLYFVVDEDGLRLEAPFTNGFSGFEGRRVDVEGPGIVALVARTRLAYCMGDRREGDPYYVTGCEITGADATRSEQAVPIEFGGRLLGVLNQESPTPDAFNSASARSLQEDGIRLVRHLLALEVAEGHGPNPPGIWNPDRHGWDIVEFLAFIATQLKEGAGRARDATHVCLWYADPADSLSALATTGYGSTFLHASLNPPSASMETYFTGALALRPDGTVEDCLAGDPRMARLDVDEAMGLRRVRAVVVRRCLLPRSEDDAGRSGMVLSFYAFDDEAEAALPGPDELREVAALLREQIECYSELRPRLAEAFLRETLYACPDSADQLTEAAALIGKVLSSAATVFLRPRGSNRLHVAAATGPLDSKPRRALLPCPPPREQSLIESGYEVSDGTFTGWFAARPGRALRINDLRARLPADCPRRGAYKVRERLPKTVDSFRRFIGYSLPSRSGSHTLGFVRCIRTSDSRPFTLCDVEALRRMVDACADAVRSWRDWYDDAVSRTDAASEKGRLLQPLPRTTDRPIVSLAREILVDVHGLVNDHFRGAGQPNEIDYVLQVGVLIEQPGNRRRPMAILAYHSELGFAAPDPRNRLALEAPRLPGVGWADLLDRGVPMSFVSDRDTDDVDIRAGARIPFVSWCGRRQVRGVLVVDLTHPERFEPTLMADLGIAASKIGTVLAAAGVDGHLSKVTPDAPPAVFLAELRDLLGAQGVRLGVALQDGTSINWTDGPIPPTAGEDRWAEPMIAPPGDGPTVADRDARRWGVREQVIGRQVLLRVPLWLGSVQRVGELAAVWPTGGPEVPDRGPEVDPASLRSRRIRDIIALWKLWTWSWSWRGSRRIAADPVSGGTVTLLHRVETPPNLDESGAAIAWPIDIKFSRHPDEPSPIPLTRL